jgi:biotin carboxylase
MKKILILGAGVYQVPLIKKSKELGLKTVVVSYAGNYPGFKIADKNYYIDTTDSDGVLKVAKKEKINGICTTGSDVPMVTLARVSNELKLPGISEESALMSTNKLLMKESFQKNNVRTAKFILIKNFNDVRKNIRGFRMPVMFKVVDSSGSKGIFKVCNNSQIDDALIKIKANTKKKYFVIEEFLKGSEFGAQAFVYKGKIKFILPHGDFIFRSDASVPIGHFVPFKLKESIIEDLHIQLGKALQSLKLDNCAINADFILKDNKIFVLEIGARAGATCLPELVSIYYGFDYYDTIIKTAIDEKPDFLFRTKRPNASILIFSDKTGIIKRIDNRNSFSENIIEIKFDYNTGEKINKFNAGPDRIGHIIVKGNTLRESLRLLKKVNENITVEVG